MKQPSFGGSGEEKARHIVQWVERHLQNEWLSLPSLLKIGHRTPRQIISSGKYPAVLGCLDKAVVIGALLKENGFDALMVIERVYHDGKSIGLHFSVQATDGTSRFIVDPHVLQTRFVSGEVPSRRGGELSFPFSGKKDVQYKSVLRVPIPKNAMNLSALQLAGIRDPFQYLRLAKISPLHFARFVKSRAAKKRLPKAPSKRVHK